MLKVIGFAIAAIVMFHAPGPAAAQEWCGGTTGLSDTGSPYATCRYTSQQQCQAISYNCTQNPFSNSRQPPSRPKRGR